MNNQKNQNNKGPKKNRQGWGVIMMTTLLTFFIITGLYSMIQGKSTEEISYNEFLEMVDDGKVEKVLIQPNKILITLKDEARNDPETTQDIIQEPF